MDETASEEELVHKQEGDESQDYFVRSGTGTDKKLMRSVIGSRHKLTLKGGGGTEDDEMEDDPSDETAERDIRCGLFYTKC